MGILCINNYLLPGDLFSGPLLPYGDSKILIPKYLRGFFRSGFKLVQVDLSSLIVSELSSKIYGIILLKSVGEKEVLFYDDLQNKNLLKLPLN